jgi:hypothetical protein
VYRLQRYRLKIWSRSMPYLPAAIRAASALHTSNPWLASRNRYCEPLEASLLAFEKHRRVILDSLKVRSRDDGKNRSMTYGDHDEGL